MKNKDVYEKEMRKLLKRKKIYRSSHTNFGETQNNYSRIRIFNPYYKLFSGIFMSTISFILIFDIGNEYLQNFKNFLKNDLLILNQSLAAFLYFVLSLMIFVFLIKGLYRIMTFNIYLPAYENQTFFNFSFKYLFNNSFNKSYQSNIDRVMSYRESKMASMNANDSADFLIKTSGLDALKNNNFNSYNVQRAKSYAESKLSSMTGERAMEWFAGKK